MSMHLGQLVHVGQVVQELHGKITGDVETQTAKSTEGLQQASPFVFQLSCLVLSSIGLAERTRYRISRVQHTMA